MTPTGPISRRFTMVADFEAFVLTGGKSERMGRDKALIEIDAMAMAQRVGGALERAGASRVTCVGGDRDALSALGLRFVADEFEDAGPLGGVITAVAACRASSCVIAPCDLLDPNPQAFAELVLALDRTPNAEVAVPVADRQWRPLPCAFRKATEPMLRAAFAAGERAVHRALANVVRVEVVTAPMPDADLPGDLPGHQ